MAVISPTFDLNQATPFFQAASVISFLLGLCRPLPCYSRVCSGLYLSLLFQKNSFSLYFYHLSYTLPHLLCTALSWAVQYRPVCIAQSIPVSSTVYLNDKFPCLNASIVFLVSDVAVVLGPWCVVHRSTWQVNEELGGPAKIRDGGFVGVW